VYKIFVLQAEGERILGDCHRWKGNIKTNIIVLRCEGVDCVHLAQDRIKWRAMHPLGSRKGEKFLMRLGDYQLLKDSAPWISL
jgi:hypothetical protein